ncbi:MAG: RNA polymerase sigma-70 factor [Bacteroidales bacterium]|jgi:RNA polymerase sigma-70 factor (ECF subfamily)|nr:RNA polymerase sigma-70 factor [Bacteroidales bacterium]
MIYDKTSEKELVSLIILGDEKAFRFVFDRYYQGLVRFSCSYTHDTFVAENIVQESYVLLWEKKHELDIDSNLHAFLTKIVKLKTWNHIEKQRRRMDIEKDLYDDFSRELNLKLYSLESMNVSGIYISEIEKIVQETLQTLPEQTQMIFKLSRDEFLPNRKIAEQMNLSEKSIEYHISKVLKVLRLELSDYLKIIILINSL